MEKNVIFVPNNQFNWKILYIMRIDRSYTIRYSKGGISQYADFKYCEGKLVHNSFYPSWVRADEVPDISQLTCINEILAVIKNFSYANRAEIYLINGAPPFMENRTLEKVFVKESASKLELFYKKELSRYYKKFLKPFILKNGWSLGKSGVGYPVLIKQYDVDKYGEVQPLDWDNVRNCKETYEFEYLCQDILFNLGLIKEKKSMRSEQGSSDIWCSHYLFQYLDSLEDEKNFVNVW
jgi:hypothetical protein